MNSFLRMFFCVPFITFLVEAGPIEKMKNLEIKVQLDQENLDHLAAELKPFFAENLFQTDTYFETHQGRLKLREEKGKNGYLIRYQRPDLEQAKQSDYLFYPVADRDLFLTVLGDSLKEEIKVIKRRALYKPKPHIRVHLDQVEDLGDFLEIEIILSQEVPLSVAETEMRQLQDWLQLNNLRKITQGYRELLQLKRAQSFTGERDLGYYKNQNKVFWVIADDLEVGNFRRYDVIPCLYVEQFDDGSFGIIQLDPSIATDCYQYTAWRKLIGQEYGFRAEILLIDVSSDKLYTLRGDEVKFDSLSRSPRFVNRSYLAPFAKIG